MVHIGIGELFQSCRQTCWLPSPFYQLLFQGLHNDKSKCPQTDWERYFTLNLQQLLPKTGAQYEKGDVENALIKYSWGRMEIDTF